MIDFEKQYENETGNKANYNNSHLLNYTEFFVEWLKSKQQETMYYLKLAVDTIEDMQAVPSINEMQRIESFLSKYKIEETEDEIEMLRRKQ